MPGASFGEPMNSMPADSRADFILVTVDIRASGRPLLASIVEIVLKDTPEIFDKSAPDHPIAVRAARI